MRGAELPGQSCGKASSVDATRDTGRPGARVIVAIEDAEVASTVIDLVERIAAVRRVRAVQANVEERLFARRDSMLLVGAEDAEQRDIERLVRGIRRSRLDVPVLVCLAETLREVQNLGRYARAGVDDVLFVFEPDGEAEVVRAVRTRLRHHLPSRLFPADLAEERREASAVAAWILRNSYRPLTGGEAVSWFRRDHGTLNRTLARGGLGSMRDFVRVGRLLHLAHTLERTDESASVTARRLRFGSATALRMFLKRLTGLTVRQLSETGLDAATQRLAEIVRRREA